MCLGDLLLVTFSGDSIFGGSCGLELWPKTRSGWIWWSVGARECLLAKWLTVIEEVLWIELLIF